VDEYKKRAEGIGEDWRDMMCDVEFDQVLSVAGIKKVSPELLIIKNCEL